MGKVAVTAGEQQHTETWSRDWDAGRDEVAVLPVAPAHNYSGRSKDGQTVATSAGVACAGH